MYLLLKEMLGQAKVFCLVLYSIQSRTCPERYKFRSLSNRQLLTVNHSEMLKTYKSIAGSLPNLKKKQFQKPTPFHKYIE